MTGACIWCGTAFAPRTTGGSTQRFCSRDCRQDFYTACRTWGVQEYEAGRLPMSELRGCVAQRARLLQCDPGLERCQVTVASAMPPVTYASRYAAVALPVLR